MFSPHMEGIHCITHDFMNFIHTLTHLFMMSKIEKIVANFLFLFELEMSSQVCQAFKVDGHKRQQDIKKHQDVLVFHA